MCFPVIIQSPFFFWWGEVGVIHSFVNLINLIAISVNTEIRGPQNPT